MGGRAFRVLIAVLLLAIAAGVGILAWNSIEDRRDKDAADQARETKQASARAAEREADTRAAVGKLAAVIGPVHAAAEVCEEDFYAGASALYKVESLDDCYSGRNPYIASHGADSTEVVDRYFEIEKGRTTFTVELPKAADEKSVSFSEVTGEDGTSRYECEPDVAYANLCDGGVWDPQDFRS